MKRLACVVLVASCARAGAPAAPLSHHKSPTPIPEGWTTLPGPFADPTAPCAPTDRCRPAASRAIPGDGDLRAATLVTRGVSRALAIETHLGWFVEPLPEFRLDASRHSPHSSRLDPAHLRVERDALIVRIVDDRATFYPGQGPEGTSSTVWSERTCALIDGAVRCSAAATIATKECTTAPAPGAEHPIGGPDYKRTCTGGEPGGAATPAP